MHCQMTELKPPNDYRLFNFDFVDTNFDDFYRCQIVLKMFLEIDVVDKFKLSVEVVRWRLSSSLNSNSVHDFPFLN